MLYRNRNYNHILYSLVFLVLALALGVFFYRVWDGSIGAGKDTKEKINIAKNYQMGTIYDSKGTQIVTGTESDSGTDSSDSTSNKVSWTDDKTLRKSMSNLIGPFLWISKANYQFQNSKWLCLYGLNDNRFQLRSLLPGFQKRVGGSVKLTVDGDLQKYVYKKIKNKDVGCKVIVSNTETGEILAAASNNAYDPETTTLKTNGSEVTDSRATDTVFAGLEHPGSNMKLAITAAALSIDPSLKDFKYTCHGSNTFDIGNGEQRTIRCSGGCVHGTVGLTDAMAYSCNGYFIALAKEAGQEKMEAKMKELFGFDQVISYDTVSFTDSQFASKSVYNFYLSCIGEGNAKMSVFAMNHIVNIIANDGVDPGASLVTEESINGHTGMKAVAKTESKRVLTKDCCKAIKKGMLAAAKYGTGRNFAPHDGSMLVKTGTAENFKKNTHIVESYTLWTSAFSTEKPYSVTVCLTDCPTSMSSKDAGEIAAKVLKHIVNQ